MYCGNEVDGIPILKGQPIELFFTLKKSLTDEQVASIYSEFKEIKYHVVSILGDTA